MKVLAILTLGLLAFPATAQGVRPLVAKSGAKPFTYTNAPAALPNYLSGEKWGTQGNALTQMQIPLSPQASLDRLVLPPGFRADLVAAEPNVAKPITLAWDERGRLWIAETFDYPNDLKPPGQGRDRIKICEDTNGDGRADKFTVFADKLSIPTSLCFANGGVIAIEGGRTIFLRDTTGDDVADERRVLFSGWGTDDTHATASNLRYGPDNWIWGTVGYSGFNGEVGGKKHRFGMGVYRFKPDGSALEFIRSSNNNTWGLGISEDCIIFGSTANNNASWCLAIPNRFYEAVNGWSASRMETIADSQQFYPVTDKVRQVDAHGRYTAGAGHALYTARAFPSEYWNRIAFVAEPTGHLVGYFRMDANGADFKAVNLGSFLASDDEWTAPIVAEVGPDGAVWVIDWYNYIVQHNPTPIGFQTGKGNAYETSLRDKRHGRIYRIAATGGTPTKAPQLASTTPSDLVAALTNDNQLWRMHAQRLLVERSQKDVVPALVQLTKNQKQDAAGLNVGAMHALWTLRGLGAVGDEAVAALKHPAPGVRRAAVDVLPRTEVSEATLLGAGVISDADPQVRLATFLALAEMPDSVKAGQTIILALAEPRNANDRWLREAAAAAGARHFEGFAGGLAAIREPLPPPANEAVRIVFRHYSAGAPSNVVDVLGQQASATTATAVIEGLAAGWPEDRPPALNSDQREQLSKVMNSLPDGARDPLLVLAQKWGRLDLFPEQVAASTARLKTLLADPRLPDSERIAVARNLVRLADNPATVEAVLGQVTLQSPPTLAGGLLNALGESRQPSTGAELLGQWKRFTPAQKRAAMGTLVRRGPWAAAVLDQIESGAIHPNDLGGEQWQQLRNNPDAAVAARAKSAAARQGSLSTDRAEVVTKFLPAARQNGDATRGKEVFTANCGVCHLFYGQGGKVGPDLSGIGVRPKEELLAEILDPNRSVESNYVLWTVATKSGDTLSGRLDTETQTSIELYDLLGQKHAIQRQDLVSLDASNQSIMPTGFEQLGESSLADLLTFLAAGAQQAKR
ncbi:MAG TPA: c-type cytochrome [Verrucomicrobiota bacterium]|nr:glycosyl hydrolase [Verrucomicrobiales bacterium]HRI12204.1 c-type cytochrome [Verrucomicrobiota bacterium]